MTPEPGPPPKTRLRDRPTGDLLVLGVAGTVCSIVLATVAAVLVTEIVHPEADTSLAAGQVSDVLNTLIGLMAGFLAGRTDLNKSRNGNGNGSGPDQR